jgi:ubiquinone/menaquinone biosynthesis C-methylase UbiE
VDDVTRRKWDRAAANFDLMAGHGPEKRWAPFKREFFARMGEGRILFLAVGTGLDIPFFPGGRSIVGIDISQRMLDKARPRAEAYDGALELQQVDVHEMPFADDSFDPPGHKIVGIDISPNMIEIARDRAAAYEGEMELRVMDVHEMDFEPGRFDQVFTSCTFCSVPNPVDGLAALARVMKPGGELHMFEHTGSRWFPFSLMMNVMTPLSRRLGPEMNRDTVGNVQRAGFRLDDVRHVYLDVVKTIHATAA